MPSETPVNQDVIDSVGGHRGLGVAEDRAIVADAVAVDVKAIFNVMGGARLELRDARQSPVVDDVAEDFHAAFGMPQGGCPDIRQDQALAVVIL